ncbi:MAG: fimbrillin family protein, partial [Bacteroidaceae bacterium]|nr:fimbrillin family protein [Bacteroidaceae bacterium]
MNYRKLMLAMASAVLVASCSSNGEEVRPDQKQESVSFTASMKTLSRATETSFEENDQIIVYAVKDEGNGTELKASGNYANYVKYTYRGNKFVNDQGIVRPTEFGVRYFAMYPNTITSVPTFRFNVKTAQGASGQYTMSDLCTAVSDVTTAKEVNLIFSHRLSHVVVNLQGEALGTGTATVKLNNVNTGCNVDLNANTFTAYESRSTVYCADNGTNSYKAIIVPQTIEAGSPFLTVTLNGKEHTLKAASDINLTSGKQQVFNLTINKDEIVSFTGNILPWGEEDERIAQVIPDDIRQKMEPYIPIYDGVNPPNVEGCYLLDPMVAVYMEDYDGDLSELQWMGEYINLTNQNKNDNTIDMEEL